jgi:hypothetical protein
MSWWTATCSSSPPAAGPTPLLATAYDLKVFFSAVSKEPTDVVTADIFTFITAQKASRRGSRVVRLEDGEAGAVSADHQAPTGQHLRPIRILDDPRWPRR